MKYDFIEIGTSDFQTLLQTTEVQIGLSIDPIKLYLNNLPNNSHVIKVNCAISDRNGIADVFWLDPKDIEEYNLPWYLRGCNSIIKPHKTTMMELEERNLEFLLKQTTCEMITWKTLVERYDVNELDVLKIDTEGHDCVIINDIIDNDGGVLPKKIFFEGNQLTNPEFIRKTISRLEKLGYTLIYRDDSDITLERL
jgi:FkbM family methyltransferase